MRTIHAASPFAPRKDLATKLHQELVKVSKPRVDLDENADAWKQKAEDALIQQHPWVSKVNVHTTMGMTSSEGYGVGFFHLTPRQVPAAATGEDQVNVLSVPIIISDYRLAPLDIFQYGGQFYPLNEERALRLLNLPDIFVETDRSRQDFERSIYNSSRRFGNNVGLERWGRFGADAGKYSSAAAGSRVEQLRSALTEAISHCLREPSKSTREKLSSLCAHSVAYAGKSPLDIEERLPVLRPFMEYKVAESAGFFGQLKGLLGKVKKGKAAKAADSSTAAPRRFSDNPTEPWEEPSVYSWHFYGGNRLPLKEEARHNLRANRAQDAAISALTSRDVNRGSGFESWSRNLPDHLKQSAAEGYKELAELCGIELEVRQDAIYSRDWWYSSPDDGLAKVSSWTPSSYHDVEQALGPETAKNLLEKRWLFQPFKQSCARGRFGEAMMQQGGFDLEGDLAQLSDRAWIDASVPFSKQSKMMVAKAVGTMRKSAGAPAIKVTVVNPKKRLGLPESFECYIINSPVCDGLGNTRLGFLLPSGTMVLPPDTWGSLDDMHALPTGGTALESLPEITGVRRFVKMDRLKSKDFDLLKVIIWITDGVIQAMLVTEDQIELDGQRYYEAYDSKQWRSDTDEEVSVLVRISQDFARMMREEGDGATILHAPKGSRVISLGKRRDVDDEAVKTSAPEHRVFDHGNPRIEGIYIKRSAPLSLGWEEPEGETADLDVRFERGLFQVKCSQMQGLLPGREWKSDRDAAVELYFLGLDTGQTKQVLSHARRHGWCSVELETPDLGFGRRAMDEALESVREHEELLHKHASQLDSDQLVKISAALWGHQRAMPQGKVSSVTLGMTVDAALSLGFLTRQNLMKFVDARPELEDCLSRLCSLLLACRIGLTEVPEDAVEMAIEGLEPVLQGLRVLEMGLKAY